MGIYTCDVLNRSGLAKPDVTCLYNEFTNIFLQRVNAVIGDEA